jgi:hypothetical protein
MRFEETGHAASVAGNASRAYQAGMGVAAGDLDTDGLIDLAVTNFYGDLMPAQRLVNGTDGRLADGSDRAGAPWMVQRMGRGLAVGDIWPSGSVSRYRGLPAGNGYLLDEGEDKPRNLSGFPWIAPRE